jgi:hypothetical protein
MCEWHQYCVVYHHASKFCLLPSRLGVLHAQCKGIQAFPTWQEAPKCRHSIQYTTDVHKANNYIHKAEALARKHCVVRLAAPVQQTCNAQSGEPSVISTSLCFAATDTFWLSAESLLGLKGLLFGVRDRTSFRAPRQQLGAATSVTHTTGLINSSHIMVRLHLEANSNDCCSRVGLKCGVNLPNENKLDNVGSAQHFWCLHSILIPKC